MTSEWAISSNADVDDDFFSTIDKSEFTHEQDDINYTHDIDTTNDESVHALLASPSVTRSGNDIYDIGQEENDYQNITETIDDNPNIYSFVDEPITVPSSLPVVTGSNDNINDYDNENNTNNIENVDVVLATGKYCIALTTEETVFCITILLSIFLFFLILFFLLSPLISF